MGAKLQAILNATQTGESVILANGLSDDVLDQISIGEEIGTLFLASGSTIPAWKRWIGYSARPEGTLQLDDGACKAVVQNGKSLLAVGIRNVIGTFGQGASVSLTQADGREVARGLVNYTAEEIRRIAGHRSESIPDLLGHIPYREVIHRDNLVVTDGSRVFSLGKTTDAPPVQP